LELLRRMGHYCERCFPIRFVHKQPMKVSGLFVIAQSATNLIVTNFLDHKARGLLTTRFVFLLNCELGYAPIHRTKLLKKQVVISIPKLYTSHEKSQKDVELTSLYGFFDLINDLHYNVAQLATNQTVVNLNTTFNLIDFSQAAFLHGASVRYTIVLRYVVLRWNPRHTLVPCTKAVFYFPKKAVICYAM